MFLREIGLWDDSADPEAVVRKEGYRRASPIVFGPRIPDFLSRFVALSNFMRLSLRESRIRDPG